MGLTLERAAIATGGRFQPDDRAIAFDPEGEQITHYEDLWPRLVMAALGCFLLDVFFRRVRLFHRKFRGDRAGRAFA